jgi:hypothetical protein
LFSRGDSIANGITYALHALAALAVMGGVLRSLGAESAELSSMLMAQYLLWAILLEMAALNLKK